MARTRESPAQVRELPAPVRESPAHARELPAPVRELPVATQVLTEYVAAARRRLGFTLAESRQGVLLMRKLDVVTIQPEIRAGRA